MQTTLHQLGHMTDGGARYAETHLGSFIVEPWNAISSFILLMPGIIWLWKNKGNFRENIFLSICFSLLFIGGLGSAFFHAFRSSSLLLQMDILPMLLLTVCISWYFWSKVLKETWQLVLILSGGFLTRIILPHLELFSAHTSGNISYTIAGLVIFLPAILYTRELGFQRSFYLYLSVLFFGVALMFRELDTVHMSFLPMGTHFLWHIFTAVGGYYLAEFVIKIEAEKTFIPEPLIIPSKSERTLHDVRKVA